MKLEMKNILVTGGSGFLGGYLLYKLTALGYKPTAIKRTSSNLTFIKKIFSKKKQTKLFNNIKWVDCDLHDIVNLKKNINENDVVFHCAGCVSFNKNDVHKIYKTNYVGTKNLINICLEKSILKFCHVSSIATMANNNKTINENNWFSQSNENKHYAISKHFGEMEVWRGFAEGLKGFIVNPSLIIGPEDTTSLFGKMIPIIKKSTFFFPNGGTGFVDVRDVANILIKLNEKNANHMRYIINSENLSFKKVLYLFAKKTNGIKPRFKINNTVIKFFILINILTNPYNKLSLNMIDFFKSNSKYSNDKIKKELSYKFISVEQSIIDILSI